MVGPSPQVMGGVSVVVRTYMASDLPNKINMRYLNTHVDGNKLVKFLIAIKAYLNFPVVCLVFKPDIVHINLSSYFSFYRKFIIFVMAKSFQIKTLVNIRCGRFMDFYNSSKIHAFFIKMMLDSTNAILMLAESWRKKIQPYTCNKNIFVIYHPVDTSIYKNLRPWERKDNTKKVLFMGKICKGKGVYDIIQSIPAVKSIYPEVLFILAGNGEVNKARALCENINVSEYVEFPGWIIGQEKMKYLAQADVCQLPSYFEGLPSSILEAMAAGLPVIATRVGGIPDIIEDGINGYLIQPGNTEAMQEKLLLLLSSPDLREKFGKANKLKAKEKFDINIIIPQLCSVYEQVLYSPSGR
jgi:glycosyltransferase involved in cell wall biosynthesis